VQTSPHAPGPHGRQVQPYHDFPGASLAWFFPLTSWASDALCHQAPSGTEHTTPLCFRMTWHRTLKKAKRPPTWEYRQCRKTALSFPNSLLSILNGFMPLSLQIIFVYMYHPIWRRSRLVFSRSLPCDSPRFHALLIICQLSDWQ